MENQKILDRRKALKSVLQITGGVISMPITAAILGGCQATGAVDWQPAFFTSQEALAVQEIVDIILPKSASPSGSEVHVPEFVDLIVKDCFSVDQQKVFRGGLNDMLNTFRQKYSENFTSGMDKDKIDFISQVDAKASSSTADTFFRSFKQLTLLGYFTSEEVMKHQLNYHAIAGKYEGCTPLQSEDRVYVDNNVTG